jgi:hypothetical protein
MLIDFYCKSCKAFINRWQRDIIGHKNHKHRSDPWELGISIKYSVIIFSLQQLIPMQFVTIYSKAVSQKTYTSVSDTLPCMHRFDES